MQRTLLSPSTLPRWLQLESEVLSSCSGNFGSWPVSSLGSLISGHVLTVARYLFGLLCQRHRQRHRKNRLASPAWFSVYPILHPRCWHLLLSRVASLAHEARPVRQRIPIHASLASSSNHRSKRLLLLLCHLPRGAQSCPWCGLLLTSAGLFHRAPDQASQLRCLDGYDRSADVRYQQ